MIPQSIPFIDRYSTATVRAVLVATAFADEAPRVIPMSVVAGENFGPDTDEAVIFVSRTEESVAADPSLNKRLDATVRLGRQPRQVSRYKDRMVDGKDTGVAGKLQSHLWELVRSSPVTGVHYILCNAAIDRLDRFGDNRAESLSGYTLITDHPLMSEAGARITSSDLISDRDVDPADAWAYDGLSPAEKSQRSGFQGGLVEALYSASLTYRNPHHLYICSQFAMAYNPATGKAKVSKTSFQKAMGFTQVKSMYPLIRRVEGEGLWNIEIGEDYFVATPTNHNLALREQFEKKSRTS